VQATTAENSISKQATPSGCLSHIFAAARSLIKGSTIAYVNTPGARDKTIELEPGPLNKAMQPPIYFDLHVTVLALSTVAGVPASLVERPRFEFRSRHPNRDIYWANAI
jgi:hypothetical protein